VVDQIFSNHGFFLEFLLIITTLLYTQSYYYWFIADVAALK